MKNIRSLIAKMSVFMGIAYLGYEILTSVISTNWSSYIAGVNAGLAPASAYLPTAVLLLVIAILHHQIPDKAS